MACELGGVVLWFPVVMPVLTWVSPPVGKTTLNERLNGTPLGLKPVSPRALPALSRSAVLATSSVMAVLQKAAAVLAVEHDHGLPLVGGRGVKPANKGFRAASFMP